MSKLTIDRLLNVIFFCCNYVLWVALLIGLLYAEYAPGMEPWLWFEDP